MYKPTQDDIDYAKSVMNTQDGSLIRMPSADLVYRKQSHKLILICGQVNSKVHLRTIDVFRQIGVEVSVKISPRALVMAELRSQVLRGNSKILIDSFGLQDLHNLLNAHRLN